MILKLSLPCFLESDKVFLFDKDFSYCFETYPRPLSERGGGFYTTLFTISSYNSSGIGKFQIIRLKKNG